MNAVNLIPADSRKQRPSLAASPLTLGVIGGLLVILAAAVLYVSTVNKVTQRRSELAQVTASAASWQAAANSFSPVVASAQTRAQQFAAVRQLAAARYPWEQLLSQLSSLMPAKAALSSLQAATVASDAPASPSSSSSTSSSSTVTSVSATPAAAPQPTVQLSGCAASQSTVAQTMVQLNRINGVSAVILSSSADASNTNGGSSGSSGQGGCPFPVAFQVSLTFSAPATAAPSSGSSTSTVATSSTSATPTTPASTTPAASATPTATPATATSTPTTGAAQ